MELPAQVLRPFYSRESILARRHDLFTVGGEDADVAGGKCFGSLGSAGSDD